MKKMTMAAIALACAASVSAQVVSQNIVGYNTEVSAGGFMISGMQFKADGGNTPTTVYGDSLPLQSRIYTWNADIAEYEIVTYASLFVPFVGPTTKWSGEPNLAIGEGYWVESAGAAESVLAGTVSSEAAITNSISAGFQMCSYPYPVERLVKNLGFTPTIGDRIYLWDAAIADYKIITYSSVFVPFVGPVTKWSDENAPIAVGEGFWYEAMAPQEWVANKPF